MFRLATLCTCLTAGAATADQSAIIEDIVGNYIQSSYQTLGIATAELASVTLDDCDPSSDALRAAYNEAFDAWVAVSHLRFGPSEEDDRAFALAFWPDPRGSTPKTLRRLLAEGDEIAASAEDYAAVSIAARGFYAMEFLLYDAELLSVGSAEYGCQLIQTVAADIAANTFAIQSEWQEGFQDLMLSPQDGALFQTEQEVVQEFFKALTLGFQFTSEQRIGRPLADLDRPRPRRAETWRSGRSSRNIAVAIASLADLADRLSDGQPDVQAQFADAFERSDASLALLEDPIFTDISDPVAWFKLKDVQTNINQAWRIAEDLLGPSLGVTAGFNALDGD